MSPLDRLVARQEIADVIGRYCHSFDDQQWDALTELWTDDAAFVVEDNVFEGRDALMTFLRTCLPEGYQSKHVISPPVVDVADDGRRATARTDVVWIAENFENTIVARYEDVLVLDGEHWRIQRRVEVPVQHRPGPPPMSDDALRASRETMRATR
jgi:ketosteroid isomerase-like protein